MTVNKVKPVLIAVHTVYILIKFNYGEVEVGFLTVINNYLRV